MVAGNQKKRHFPSRHFAYGPVEKPDSLHRGDLAVINIPGQDDKVRLLAVHGGQENLFDKIFLILQ